MNETLEEGELNCSLGHIEKVWEHASRLHTPEKGKAFNGTLGDLTPGIFEIKRMESGNPWAGQRAVGEKEGWLARDLARRGRNRPDYDVYCTRLEAEEEEMRKEYAKMSDDLERMRKERETMERENEQTSRQIKEHTERLRSDRKYQGEKFAEESLALARTRSEKKKVEEEMNAIVKEKEETTENAITLQKKLDLEKARLQKDKEEARKSRDLRDTYELEINRQSGRVKQIKEQYEREEEERRDLHNKFEEERFELGQARVDMQRELETLGKKRGELNDSYIAYKLQMEEEKKALKRDMDDQRRGPTHSSTPRTILKGYDPFERDGAMSKVSDGRYGGRHEGEENRRVTIGDTQTKEISGNLSEEEEEPMRTDHSYGSLHPFANDTVRGSHLPAAPVYNITYQYGQPTETNPVPVPTTTQVGGRTYPGSSKGDNSQDNGRGSNESKNKEEGGRKLTRRASMTPAMRAMYDSDPNHTLPSWLVSLRPS